MKKKKEKVRNFFLKQDENPKNREIKNNNLFGLKRSRTLDKGWLKFENLLGC